MNIAVKIIFAACQSYRILAYIPTCTRVVIPEPVVVQPSLLVLILPQLSKWHELSVAPEVEQAAIDVVVGLPDERSVFAVGLHGAADVVAHDAVTLAAHQLGGWNIAVGVVNPGDEVVRWFGTCRTTLRRFRQLSVAAVPFRRTPTREGQRHHPIGSGAHDR